MAITISDTEPRVQYTATSGQTSFTVSFEFFDVVDLKVYKGSTLLNYNISPSNSSQYSVAGAGLTGGGSITLGSGATVNDVYTIIRDMPISRSTDFPVSGAFQIDSLNTELDKMTAISQQLERDIKLTPKALTTTTNAYGITFPNLVANKVLSVNANGTALEFAQDANTIADITGVAAGTGLTGGGTSGDVTLNVIGGTGITANANDIAIDATVATLTGTQTLSAKTLTSPVINTGVSGTGVKDEDNMSSNSASHLATQQSIKAYVDTQVATVPVGDITSVVAGTGLSGGATSGAATVNIDATVATLVGSQTLTNKTINVDNNTVSNIEVDNLKSGVLDTALSSVSGSDNTLASAKAIKAYVDTQVATVPVGDITSVVAGTGLTGGGTSGDVTVNVIGGTGITANANDIAIDGTVATLNGSQTLTNKSIVATQLTGTVPTARLSGAYTGITSLGTITSFRSTGIDDNADATAITIDSGEDVGIGNTSPFARLVVQGANNENTMVVNTIGTSPNYIFDVRDDGTSVFRIDGSGKVGIGTSTPGSFHVSGNDLVVGNTTAGHGLTIVAENNSAGSINFADGSSSNASFRGKVTYEHSNDSLAFHAGAAEKFRVGSNGNFSIGTTADDQKLVVNGNIKTSATGNVSSGVLKGIGGTPVDVDRFELGVGFLNLDRDFASVVNQIQFGKSGTLAAAFATGQNYLVIKTNGNNERVRITSAGDLLVGTTSVNPGIGNTTTGFSVTNSGGQVGNIAVSQNGNYSANFNRNTNDGTIVQFSKNGTAKHVITTTSMGIGTTSPLGALHVESADSGVSPHADTDELFIENNGNAGLTIGTSTSGTGSIFFADSADPARGRIRYNQSNDAMTFGTAGVAERMRINSTGVGIGTSSPAENLQIMDTVSNKPQIRLETSDGGNKRLDLYIDSGVGTIAADQSAQQLAFRTANSERMRILADGKVGIGTTVPSAQFQTDVASATIGGGRIYTNAVRTGVNSSSVFSVRADNASGSSNGDVVNIQGDGVGDLLTLNNNGTDRVTFKAAGDLLVGKTVANTATAGLELRATNQAVFTRSGGQPLILNRLSDDGRIIQFKKDNTQVGMINVSGTGISITLGGTGTSNELSDYEEGTFTPNLSTSTGVSLPLNSGIDVMSYTKIGRMVHIQGLIRLASLTNPSGAFTLFRGLPFTTSSSITQYGGRGGGAIYYDDVSVNPGKFVLPFTFSENQTQFNFYKDASGYAVNDDFQISLTYFTDA